MISEKLVIFVLLGVAAATAASTASTPYAKAVAAVCQVVSDRPLCSKTLEPVKSEDPKDLIKAAVSATEASMKKSVAFVVGLKPKYKTDATATACLDVCEKQLNYAIDDLQTFMQQAGQDINTLAIHYSSLLQLMKSVYRYQSGCLDDILDEKLLKVVEDGIAEGKNLSSNALDIFDQLATIFSSLGVNVKLI